MYAPSQSGARKPELAHETAPGRFFLRLSWRRLLITVPRTRRPEPEGALAASRATVLVVVAATDIYDRLASPFPGAVAASGPAMGTARNRHARSRCGF